MKLPGIKLYTEISRFGSLFADLSLLAIRLILAYGFYKPAMLKWSDMSAIEVWFRGMHYIFPNLSAYAAASSELAGIVLLALGLMTRLISVPLIIVMVVAITTVHWSYGFDASHNGFEIPLYYLLMLLFLLAKGPGRFSLDALLFKAER